MFETIERHRPTMLFGLPTLYNVLVAHPGSEQRDLTSVRLCLSAAESLSGELYHEWQQRHGLNIVEGLGSTEVLHIYLSNQVERQKIGASGARVPGYEVKFTDPDGNIVGPGGSGVMWVRGDSQAPLYWNRPEKTAETMREDWIYTGDRFRLDEHPDVQECAVFGVEESNRLMTLAAFVVLRNGIAQADQTTRTLQDFVKSQLAPYKYPRRFFYLDGLPKTGTDKIDRQGLKRLVISPGY